MTRCAIAGLASLALVLAGCGSSDDDGSTSGSSSGGSGGSGGSGTAITLSGVATFERYGLTVSNGIDYNDRSFVPARGLSIEARSSSGTVLDSDVTTATGAYSLSVFANTDVTLVLKAELDATRVVDNTAAGSPLYTAQATVATGETDTTFALAVSGGWGGSSYSAPRSAGPFAILDTVYKCRELVRSVDPAISFPALDINWSPNNTEDTIGTSFWSPSQQALFLLGGADEDTDEYDEGVVAHEWVHYFDDRIARSDSIGGPHGPLDQLDPTLAFGEGFATAFSGIALGAPRYIDTAGPQQGFNRVFKNHEVDAVADNLLGAGGLLSDGFYSEDSLIEVLWDLYDDDASDDDNDGVGLGFAPIYEVMLNGNKNTPAFTSIFSFLYHLKQTNPGQASAIAAIAAAENVPDGDEFQGNRLLDDFYTPVPADGSTVTTDLNGEILQTRDTFDPENLDSMFRVREFLYADITMDGDYALTVTPASGFGVVWFPGSVVLEQAVAELNGVGTGATISGLSLRAGDRFAFAVNIFSGSDYIAAPFSVSLTRTGTLTKPAGDG